MHVSMCVFRSGTPSLSQPLARLLHPQDSNASRIRRVVVYECHIENINISTPQKSTPKGINLNLNRAKKLYKLYVEIQSLHLSQLFG